MSDATITLEMLVACLGPSVDSTGPFTLEGRVPVLEDGYANANEHYFPIFTCPHCQKDSIFNTEGSVAQLTPMRTDKDMLFLKRNKISDIDNGKLP
jgi:hypothetical protein